MQNIQNTIKHTDQKYYINCEHVFNMLIQIWHYTKICFSVISFLICSVCCYLCQRRRLCFSLCWFVCLVCLWTILLKTLWVDWVLHRSGPGYMINFSTFPTLTGRPFFEIDQGRGAIFTKLAGYRWHQLTTWKLCWGPQWTWLQML